MLRRRVDPADLDMRDTIMEAIGIEVTGISEERVVATMPVHGATKQPFGILHGGASVVLAETVASLGTYNLIDRENELAVGLEIHANHIRSKDEGLVTAVGTLLHRGRSWSGTSASPTRTTGSSASRAARWRWCRNSLSALRVSRQEVNEPDEARSTIEQILS
jgi:1,4-dihydroxy-2-naphthoyl-CoA hydrolase